MVPANQDGKAVRIIAQIEPGSQQRLQRPPLSFRIRTLAPVAAVARDPSLLLIPHNHSM
jgi:hypothetical protein